MRHASITVIVSSVFVLVGCTKPREDAGLVQPASAISEVAVEPNEAGVGVSQEQLLAEKWGIAVEFATLSAGGYMIDFRFRVLDPVKAAPLLKREVHPYLVDQSSGAKFAVPAPPKVGQLRTGGNVKAGNICFVYFANPAQYVKRGNKITVAIGDFEARDIVVQ